MACESTSGIPLLGKCCTSLGFRPYCKIQVVNMYVEGDPYYDNYIDAINGWIDAVDWEEIPDGYRRQTSLDASLNIIAETTDFPIANTYITESETIAPIGLISGRGGTGSTYIYSSGAVFFYDAPFHLTRFCAKSENYNGSNYTWEDYLCESFDYPMAYACPKAIVNPSTLARESRVNFYHSTTANPPACCDFAP